MVAEAVAREVRQAMQGSEPNEQHLKKLTFERITINKRFINGLWTYLKKECGDLGRFWETVFFHAEQSDTESAISLCVWIPAYLSNKLANIYCTFELRFGDNQDEKQEETQIKQITGLCQVGSFFNLIHVLALI